MDYKYTFKCNVCLKLTYNRDAWAWNCFEDTCGYSCSEHCHNKHIAGEHAKAATEPSHFSLQGAIEKLQARYDECLKAVGVSEEEGSYEGESDDYWQGALSSASYALSVIKEIKQ